MKRLTILLTLLGCISLCSHAWWYPPYDRNFNTRSSEFTPCTVVPADSTLTTVFDGIEMSAMDYAKIYLMHGPIDKIYKVADSYIVGFGPSQRLKSLDKSSTERQKLIIADDPFYIANFEKHDVGSMPPFGFQFTDIKSISPHEDVKLRSPTCIADSLTFDFDLSEYACDFDVYILILHSNIILDSAFSNFKFSDNIKTVNIYLNVLEVGHEAFTMIKNIENVDVRLMSAWCKENYYDHHYIVYDFATDTMIYSDSFSQETYDKSLFKTNTSESQICEVLTNPSANNYSNNFYRFFKKWISGVEYVSTDTYPVEYTIQGKTVTLSNLAPKELVNVYSITGASVRSLIADDKGLLDIEISQSGFYIIRTANTYNKVIIH